MAWSDLLLSGFCAALLAQESVPFRSEVSEVHIDAGVSDKSGRSITNLTRADFRVFDEGQEQTITGFAAEEQALDIILLFDVSGSMRDQIGRIARSADTAFRELRKGDRIAVMTFTSKAKLVSPFTEDFQSVSRDIESILANRFRGNTQIREAVYEAAGYFLSNPRSQRRRAILVITDNIGGHRRSEDVVLKQLWEADAVLSGLVVPMRRPRGAPDPPFDFPMKLFAGIDKIAQESGGDSIHTGNSEFAFSELMRRIRTRYSLYYPAPMGIAGSTRTVRVQLSPRAQSSLPGFNVRARKAYVVAKQN